MTGEPTIVILAAGSSSRMGSPKQLLQVQGSTLLQRAVAIARQAVAGQVIVVTGANRADVSALIHTYAVTRVDNGLWKTGLASSVRAGLRAAIKAGAAAVIFMVCDQPLLTAKQLKALIAAAKQHPGKIIASGYAGTSGTPVLFTDKFFPELLNLQGDHGARKILLNFSEQVISLPFAEGAVDLDTPEDYARFIHDDH